MEFVRYQYDLLARVQKNNLLKKTLPYGPARDRFEWKFKQYYAQTIDSWDGQWAYACLIHGGLSINPQYNLISNIGSGTDATHPIEITTESYIDLPVKALTLPLIHPSLIVPNETADAWIFKYAYSINRSYREKSRWFLKSHFPKIYFLIKQRWGTTSKF